MNRLNLGCGLFTFPLDRESYPNPEWVNPLPGEVFEPSWCNVDRHLSPGVNEQIDLFRFPWVRSSNGNPFNDNSVDYIYASHILEHIPHQVRPARGLPAGLAQQYAEMVDGLDGFFCFFAECWRVLRPGGRMHVRFPYGANHNALSDPTHTRYLTPGSLSYLMTGDSNRPFDYDVPCRFVMDGDFDFRVSNDWLAKLRDYTHDAQMRLIAADYSTVDEVRGTLRAVKE